MIIRRSLHVAMLIGFVLAVGVALVEAAISVRENVTASADWRFGARNSVAVLATIYAPVAYYVPENPKRALVLVFGYPWPDGTASDARLLAYAQTNLAHWTNFADRNHVLLIAPALGGSNFRDFRALSGRILDPDKFLDALIDGPATVIIPELHSRFCLYGHSAGAQFAARYVIVHPERLECAILSAPSTYPMPSSNVPWPFGMASIGSFARTGIEPTNWTNAATGPPITVIVGSRDLEKRPLAPGQVGETRLSRGQAWVNSMQALARSRNQTPGVRLIEIPGVGHDELAMAEAARRILQQRLSTASADSQKAVAPAATQDRSSKYCRVPLETDTLSASEWQDDVRAMIDGIERTHKNPFHHISKPELEKAAAALKTEVPGLPQSAVPVHMAQIVSLVGDGHTRLRMPPHPTYPFRVYWFGNDLRIIATPKDHQELLGSRIERIGGYDVNSALARVQSLVSQGENRWLVMNRTPALLTDATVLWALGIASAPDHVTIQAERNGEKIEETLTAMQAGTGDAGWTPPFRDSPLYLSHQRDAFWFTTLPGTRTAYLIFNRYDDFAQHAREFLDYVRNTKPDRLVVDMRENGGGDFDLPRQFLLPQIKDNPTINRKSHLYVIIGRKTFSAAMSNAADFKNGTHAILVGEPTGERPNSYQENVEFCLPNSHLHLTVSTKYYKFVAGNPEALFPDKRIDVDWTDYKDGKDPFLSWILQQSLE